MVAAIARALLSVFAAVALVSVGCVRAAAYCYEEKWTLADVRALGTSGVPQDRATRVSTAYFKRIKGYDLYDEAGALKQRRRRP